MFNAIKMGLPIFLLSVSASAQDNSLFGEVSQSNATAIKAENYPKMFRIDNGVTRHRVADINLDSIMQVTRNQEIPTVMKSAFSGHEIEFNPFEDVDLIFKTTSIHKQHGYIGIAANLFDKNGVQVGTGNMTCSVNGRCNGEFEEFSPPRAILIKPIKGSSYHVVVEPNRANVWRSLGTRPGDHKSAPQSKEERKDSVKLWRQKLESAEYDSVREKRNQQLELERANREKEKSAVEEEGSQ